MEIVMLNFINEADSTVTENIKIGEGSEVQLML